MMRKRVIVIGMDSTPLDLLEPWMKKGYLPTLSKIFGSGSYGNLYSRIPVTPIAWSSIYTGKNPGKHGIMGFRNHKPGSYSDVGVNSTMRDATDVWDIVGTHEKKVVVVNTPLTYPPHPVNGFLVCGFMAPSTEYGFTYPASLAKEIRKVVPNYRIGTAPNYIKRLYLKELNSTVQMVGDAAKYLLKRIDWDLAFVVFKETDEVQHSFYNKPEAMLTVYQRVDRIASEFLEIAGKDSTVMVVSDHGGEPINKRFNVAEFLRRNEFIKLNQTQMKKSTNLFRLIAQTMFNMQLEWVLDIPGTRKILAQLVKARARSPSSDLDDGFYGGKIDWSGTSAFIASGIGLRINVKGREPNGFVEPKDYEKVRDRLAKELAEVKDPENGNNVFRYALPKEDILKGPHLADAPDILCLPNTGYLPTESLVTFDPLAVAASHRSLFSRSTLWYGTHSPEGIIAISGPGVAQGKIPRAVLDDVAPTILYAMGLPIPEDMDGRVLFEAFSSEHRAGNPIIREAERSKTEHAPQVLSRQEEQIIEDRLKALGYLS